ncbi:MAG: hypothetical protein KAT77_01280 [Nanoarchaeota archaeon]|nr:hypothetical protein [Nanoarchaeota archaeon]
MAEEEDKKNPWYQSNIKKTLKKRNSDQRNLINVIQAMDSQLIKEVTEILQEHTEGKGIADWSLLDEESPTYNKKVADLVVKKIDEVYSLDSKLHPLKDVIKKANLERNYFNEQLVKGLYFQHTEDLKRAIGSENFMEDMKGHQKKNLDRVIEDSAKHLTSDINPDEHADYILDFLYDEYKFDKDAVSEDKMRLSVSSLISTHNVGKLDKDLIHRQFKKYAKSRKASQTQYQETG